MYKTHLGLSQKKYCKKVIIIHLSCDFDSGLSQGVHSETSCAAGWWFPPPTKLKPISLKCRTGFPLCSLILVAKMHFYIS